MIDQNGRFVPNAAPQQQPMGAPSQPAQAAMRGQGIAPTGPSMSLANSNGFGGPAQGMMQQRAPVMGMAGPQQAYMPPQQQGIAGAMRAGGMMAQGPQQAYAAPTPTGMPPLGQPPGTSWGGAPQGGWSGPMYQPMPQMPVQRSVEQSVQTGSPQSMQNFLQALHQAGAGPNNSFQVGAGQQGAGPQAGFAGFGSNGQQGGPGGGFTAYGGPMASSLSFAGNGAQQGAYGQGAAPGSSGGTVVMGGTGGLAGQPAYQAPNDGTPTAASQAWADQVRASQEARGISQTPVQPPNTNNGNIAGGQSQSNYNGAGTGTQGAHSTSDVRAKEAITPGAGELDDFLKSLGVYSYQYKDEANGKGRRISPMAQEIESTPLGRAAVSEGPDGLKRVDYGKLGGTMLAATAHLNQKILKLDAELRAAVLGKFSAKKGKE